MISTLIFSLYRTFPPKCKSMWCEVFTFTYASLVGCCYVNNKVQLLGPEGFSSEAKESFLCMGVVLRAVQGDACRMYGETWFLMLFH